MKEKVLIKWLTIKNKNVIFKGIVHSKSVHKKMCVTNGFVAHTCMQVTATYAF